MPDDIYTHGHHESVLRSHTWRSAENSAGYLLEHLAGSQTLLDVGCGPATITCDFAERVESVVGIDAANDIVVTATETARARRVENVSIEVGSVYALRFDDDTFDITHAHQVLQHLTDPVAALREMIRVTKPGGLVAVRDADYHAMTWFPAIDELDRWMEIYQGVARRNDAEPNAARHLCAWALEAGVERERITASIDTWLFTQPADRQWWGDLWADRTVASAFGTQALDYALTTADEQQQIADGWRRWIDEPAGWFAVPNGELLIQI